MQGHCFPLSGVSCWQSVCTTLGIYDNRQHHIRISFHLLQGYTKLTPSPPYTHTSTSYADTLTTSPPHTLTPSRPHTYLRQVQQVLHARRLETKTGNDACKHFPLQMTLYSNTCTLHACSHTSLQGTEYDHMTST